MMDKENIKNKIFTNISYKITIIWAIILRIIYGLKADPLVCQHDVMSTNGHYDYAKYIFRNLKLPMTNDGEFYHPPLNAILQALFMRLETLFIKPRKSLLPRFNEYMSGIGLTIFEEDNALNKYLLDLYSNCKILSIIYSIITSIIIYKILLRLNVKRNISICIFILTIFLPGFIIFAGQYNNDGITIMFFFLSIYLAIRWCQKKDIISIILLAISIGLGMLCRISNAILAIIIGPMMIITITNWIKTQKDNTLVKDKCISKNLIFQFIIFLIISIVIGLSYATRNYILFNQGLTFVPEISKGTILEITGKNAFERFLSLPLGRLFNGPFGIYHDVEEYNIWVDLIKSAAYQEFIYTESLADYPCHMLIVLNFIFSIFSIFSFAYMIILFCNKKLSENKDLVNLALILITLSIITFVIFNINYPYSCTSNYRYVAYATFAFSSLVVLLIDYYNKFILNKVLNCFIILLLFASTLFVLLV